MDPFWSLDAVPLRLAVLAGKTTFISFPALATGGIFDEGMEDLKISTKEI